MLCNVVLLLAIQQHESAIRIHMSSPSLASLPTPSPGCHRAWAEIPVLYNNFPLAICFTYGNTYVFMLLSPFVPPSLSPTMSTSLSLCLHFCCCPANRFSNTICLDSMTVKSEVAQSCPTLCDPMGCSLPGSSVHGIIQAIVLEWIAISFSRGSSQPRDQTRVSCTVDRRFTV